MTATTRVFIYGLMRRTEPAHYLLQSQTFVGPATTSPHFELVHLGKFPGLVSSTTATAQSVAGEVYDVDPATLAALDFIESHPDAFCRTPIRLSTGETVEAYLMRPEQAVGRPRIVSGDWLKR